MYQVKDTMSDGFVAIAPDVSIDDAICLMLEHRVSGLPVVDEQDQLLGVISEIDIINLVFQADIETSTVGEHMTRDVQTLSAEASLDEAALKFTSLSMRRFPVVDQGKLVGVLSRRDLIRFLRGIRMGTPAGQPPDRPEAGFET